MRVGSVVEPAASHLRVDQDPRFVDCFLVLTGRLKIFV